MQAYDIVMVVVLLAATLFGAWKGLAWQIATLGSIFASYFVAYTYREQVGAMITAEPPWNRFLAMLLLYIGTSLVIWLGFGLISDVIDRVKLKDFDHQIGALLGAGTGVLLCVVVTLFAVTLLGTDLKDSICRSRSGYYMAMLIDRAHQVMPSEVHDVVHPYLQRLDDQLQQGQLQQGGFEQPADEPGAPAEPVRDSLFGDAYRAAPVSRAAPAASLP